MPNILNVTSPVAGYENSVKTNPIHTGDTNIQNIVDMTKVVRPDGKTNLTDNPDNKFALYQNSNFEKFIQMLQNTPQLTEIFSKIMFAGTGNLVNSGITENFAEEIAGFLEMFKMTEDELFSFIKNQSSSAVRFKGAFFGVLRQILGQTESVDLRKGIIEFVKKYSDMASGDHILRNIETNLREIKQLVLRNASDTLDEMLGRLDMKASNGDTKANEALLKNEIIPFLSKYITRTHDMGRVRDIITILTLNAARYENGNGDGVTNIFKQLLNFHGFRDKFAGIDENNLQMILMNTDYEKSLGNTLMADKLINIIRLGLKGEAGYENKQVYENIMNGILMNESVYMPVLHMIIPIDLAGRILFSELWVDPDAHEQGAGVEEKERVVKLLLKFDIKDVGFFDLILAAKSGKIDLQLFYPEILSPMEKGIRGGLTGIIEKNGMTIQNLSLEKSVKPIEISQVFPKIFERKNSVNVRI